MKYRYCLGSYLRFKRFSSMYVEGNALMILVSSVWFLGSIFNKVIALKCTN
jgi:hypothetical protein